MANILFIIGFGKINYSTMKEWIGFCQYRKFWTLEKNKKEFNTINELNKVY